VPHMEAFRLEIFSLQDNGSLPDPHLCGTSVLSLTPIRSPARDTSSDDTVDAILEWMTRCDARHQECKQESSLDAFMPRRLLCFNHDTVRLVDDIITSAKYVCLSYCWGGKQPFMLTSTTQAALTAGCKITEIPQLFSDVIGVARRLGFCYIWIDAL
jgi:hypothetical protein